VPTEDFRFEIPEIRLPTLYEVRQLTRHLDDPGDDAPEGS
jgi:hypothetical protein